jgi:hypothetical protein
MNSTDNNILTKRATLVFGTSRDSLRQKLGICTEDKPFALIPGIYHRKLAAYVDYRTGSEHDCEISEVNWHGEEEEAEGSVKNTENGPARGDSDGPKV